MSEFFGAANICNETARRRASWRYAALASPVAIFACLSSPVAAQSADDVLAEQAAVANEIVVTANRTTSLASKTPIALSAVTGDDLGTAGVTNPTALADVVPNISIDRTDGLQITIRGISSNDNTEKGDPSAAFLVDGIYIARPQAQEVSFYDLDRVEVLRGPQGTLYGRNTTAGVVNIIAARPRHTFAASVDAAYGNFDTQQITGMVNLPVTSSVAVRAAVNYDRRDSYILPGDSPFDISPFKNNLSGRLSILADISDRTDLLLRADYSSIKGKPTNTVSLYNFFQPFEAAAPGQRGVNPLERTNISSDDRRLLGYIEGAQSSRDNETWGVMGELNHRFTDDLTLTYLGSYREFTRDESVPGLTGFVPGTNISLSNPGTLDGFYWQMSHELRFAYSSDKLEVQAGGYYFKERSRAETIIIGLIGQNPGDYGYIFGFPQNPTISESIAGFGQATFNLTDSLHLTGGLRYTSDTKSRRGATIFHGYPGEELSFPPDSLNYARRRFNKLTWKAGVDYELGDLTLLYGSVSTGYKAGGFNDGCLASDDQCFSPVPENALFYEPETLTAYEIGFKTRTADNFLRLNGNLFHYDYDNLQLSQSSSICGGPCQITTNAATAKIDGVELEAIAMLSPRNRLGATATWLNARYSSYEAAPGVNFADEKLDRSPEVVVMVSYDYTLPLNNGGNVTAGVRSRISDGYYLLSTAILAQFYQPSFMKTDLTVTYNAPGDSWYLQGFAKNLENAITLSSASVVAAFPGLTGGTATFQDPRTYGVRAGFKF